MAMRPYQSLMLRNIKLEIEYDGTNFSGWQVQPKLRTIQGEIEDKLEKILGEKIKLIGSGRTDVGAHALGQVANFKTFSQLDLDSVFYGLNSLLPEDIVIRNIKEVDFDFNSRYDAISKAYRYRVYLGRTALSRNYVWQFGYGIEISDIMKATEKILGKNDFSSFCVAKSSKKNNFCNVSRASWRKRKEELIFEIKADRFLHSMVRILVGTLMDVGRGYFEVGDFENILKSKDRKKAGKTAPACGLYLVKVNY
jgi:tRNA pseudouridine38-40 synthase